MPEFLEWRVSNTPTITPTITPDRRVAYDADRLFKIRDSVSLARKPFFLNT